MGEAPFDLEHFFAQVPGGSTLTHALPEGVSVTFVLSGSDGGTWTVGCDANGATVARTTAVAPDCSLRCSVEDFRALLGGALDPRRGFMEGRLDVVGDVGLVLRLHRLLARGEGP